jgi:outer membrane protein insertion porin family
MIMNNIVFLLLLSANTLALGTPAKGQKAPDPWRLSHITVSGNVSFKKYALVDKMELKPLPFRKKPRFSPARLQSDIVKLTNFYANQGFLFTTILPEITYYDSTGKWVLVHLQIKEGLCTTIAQIEFSGIIPDSTLFSRLKCKKGEPLQQANIMNDERLLKNAQKDKGFFYTTIITRQSIDTAVHQAKLNFFTSTGPRIIADSITVAGISGLKPNVILRELSFQNGDTLTTGAIKKTEKNLYRTNLITAVSIQPSINDSNDLKGKNSRGESVAQKYPIQVAIKESNFFKLKVGVGYGSNEGARGSLETSYSNFLRLGHRLALKGNLSQLLQQTQAIYSTPWFLGIPLRFDGTLYYNRFSNEDTYRGVFQGVRLSLEKVMNYNVVVLFLTKYEHVLWINPDDLPEEYPLMDTRSIGMDIIYDTRNDLLDPSRGFYNLWKIEVAGILRNNSNQFVKMTNDSRIYWKAGTLSFASGLKLGWVQPYDKSSVVPLQDQFYAGGSKSVRGFKDNFLLTSSDSTRNARSGTIVITANLLEMRFPLVWLLHGALWADAGLLADRISGVSLRSVTEEIRWTAGPGLRINTPLAIIRIDCGFKLDRRADEKSMQLHIDVGQSF